MMGKKGILRFFYKVMMVCYKKLHLWRIPIPGRDKVQADLNRMHPGENPQECVTDYYVTKADFLQSYPSQDNACHYNAYYSSREKSYPAESNCIGGSGKRAVGNTASLDRWRTARDILSRWK